MTNNYDYRVVAGDTITIEHSLGDLDLSGVEGVSFTMRHHESGALVVDKPGTIVNATDGVVGITLDGAAGETDTIGVHSAEWVVDRGTDGVRRFPVEEPLHIYVREKV